ncbi:hypothetical protein vBRpoPV13_30 [Ruegeria phage vB_RpoP-V13]|uniref:Uncharacterized protein n=1 Tax=Ruegeria phage vB_RpoP-V13 TaxID=2218612 RepID=A0A2Z4QGZ9_9CAUD|nr:hypothetical protein HYP63_gp30 [Ruegeria phage vB_RpoP-V13]AWY09387.1 hypothetical protein vBRpoPV13_30 [Ruegeria phage vB_RpoP-V13]
MAERRPLVLVSGEIQELPTGDTLPGAGGLQNNYAATAAPAVTDDDGSGYAVGSRWIDVTNDKEYVCLDASTGAAVWTETTGAGGGGTTNNYLIARQEFDLAMGTTTSTSAYAAKGDIMQAENDFHFLGVNTYLASGQTVKLMVLQVTHVDNGTATITSVLYDGTPVVISSTGNYNFYITNGIAMTTGNRYLITFVRTDGSTTSALGIPFSGTTATDENGNLSWRNAIRDTVLDYAVSDVVPAYVSTTPVGMRFYTVDNEFLTILTTGPAGADGADGADGLSAAISIVEETTTARVASNGDLAGSVLVEMNNAGAQTYTVNSGLTGTEPVTLIQKGAGAVTVVAGASVTINSLDGNLKLAGQYASATLIPSGTDNYYLVGALIA